MKYWGGVGCGFDGAVGFGRGVNGSGGVVWGKVRWGVLDAMFWGGGVGWGSVGMERGTAWRGGAVI